MMSNVGGCTDSQAPAPVSSPVPRRQNTATPKVQNAEELLCLDFCEISEEAGEYKTPTFERWQGSKDGEQARLDTSADELKKGIMNFLKLDGALLGTGEGCIWSATSTTGTTVDVSTSQITLPSGKSITLPNGISSNTRITELEDGGIVVVTANAVMSYDKDGKQLSVEEGDFNPLMGTDGNDFIINMDGEEVDGGAGDDTILNYALRTAIGGGSGNDTVIHGATFAQDISIDLGDGDDTLKAGRLLPLGEGRVAIKGGNGRDEIQIGSMVHGTLTVDAGGDDDKIRIGSMSGGTLAVESGDGNDEIELGSIMGSKFSVSGGQGNDRISAKEVFSFTESNVIDGGDGDDTITAQGIFTGNVHGGSGDDTIAMNGVFKGTINGGDGDDTISVKSVSESSIQGDKGKNTINVGNAYRSIIGVAGDENTLNVKGLYKSLLFVGGEDNAVNVNFMANSMILDKDGLMALWNPKNDAADSETGKQEEQQAALAARQSPIPQEDPSRRFTSLLARSTEIARPRLELA